MPPEIFFAVIVLRYAVSLKVNFVPANGFVICCWIFISTKEDKRFQGGRIVIK